jgi:hypothetical protein
MLENNQLPSVSKLMTLKGIICFFTESVDRWQFVEQVVQAARL